jgi:UDP-glucose 4-epimerase
MAGAGKRNWLITGGCGFIGRSVVEGLLAAGTAAGRIRVLDNLSVCNQADLGMVVPTYEGARAWSGTADTASLIVGDIRDAKATLAAAEGAEIVVHLAACTGVQPSVDDPKFDCETNVTGTLNCLEAARRAGARRFIFASSGAPLGNVTPPIHENLVARPISPYGASKLAGEAYCSAYNHCFGLETVVLRFGNVYGPLSSRKSSIVAKFIRQAMAGQTLEIYGDGSATRDYIYSGDLVRAVLAAAVAPGVGGEVFQIATNRETTVQELTERLLAVLSEHDIADVRVVYGEARRGDMPRNYSDTSKARRMLGWETEIDMMEGLHRTVAWFVAQSAAAKEIERARAVRLAEFSGAGLSYLRRNEGIAAHANSGK